MILAWNFDKFEKNNLLYVTGISGSGKSTYSVDLADSIDAYVLHLDFYYDNPYYGDYTCKEFNDYLKTALPEYFDILMDFEYYERVRFESNNSDGKFYWKVMDSLLVKIKEFSDISDKPVIAEGIQLFDSTVPEEDIYFQNESVVVIKTPPLLCAKIAVDRDELDLRQLEDKIQVAIRSNKILSDFIDMLIGISGNPNTIG